VSGAFPPPRWDADAEVYEDDEPSPAKWSLFGGKGPGAAPPAPGSQPAGAQPHFPPPTPGQPHFPPPTPGHPAAPPGPPALPGHPGFGGQGGQGGHAGHPGFGSQGGHAGHPGYPPAERGVPGQGPGGGAGYGATAQFPPPLMGHAPGLMERPAPPPFPPGGVPAAPAPAGPQALESLAAFTEVADGAHFSGEPEVDEEEDVDGSELKSRAQQALMESLGNRLYDASLSEDDLSELVVENLNGFFDDEDVDLSAAQRQRFIREVTDDLLRHGPIEPLLADPSVSEVMVNGLRGIYIEKSGKLVLSKVGFQSEMQLRRVIERIVGRVGRRIDESSPMVDARLPDGSRVNAIIPPLAVDGSTLTIRKFTADSFTVDDLIAFRSLTRPAATLLEGCVRGRLNVVVSGGTGSGKTTMLNVLSSFIPSDERIVTIEDAVELKLRQHHVVRLETRPPNIEGKGAITIRDLVRNSLRMRPDRVVIGECRGGEALDMLQAMNTGHDGSLTTLHANSPRDSLARLETLVLMAGMDLPVRAIREQIAGAVDLIVQISRLKDGSRRITHITEVVGMEGDVITLSDIYTMPEMGVLDDHGKYTGTIVPTGLRPLFADKLADYGIDLPPDTFGRPDGLGFLEPRMGGGRW
jgi:pilus assembly protein CpaF